MTVRRSLAATGLAMALAGCAVSGTDGLTSQQKAQVKRVEVCLNDPTPVEGSFIQHGPQQNGGAGHFRYAPGSLGLDYTIPHAMTLRASGAHLVLDDSQTGAVTRLNLARNPLGLLLHVPVRFDGKIRVTDIQAAPGASQISLAQADNPSQGLLTLRFLDQGNRLQLSSLDGVDARGNRILIQLSDISQGSNVTGQSDSIGVAPKN